MAKVYRLVKGTPLTHAEMDNNIQELDDLKMDKTVLTANNTVLVKDNSGDLVALEITAETILGRKSTGEIVALTKAEVKEILAIVIDDIDTLQTALDSKSDDGHSHTLAEVGITPDSGWGNPTGTADKTVFDTGTVTTAQLAGRVKAIIDTLKTQGIFTD